MTDVVTDQGTSQGGVAVEEDDNHHATRNSVHQRLRANSSVIPLKKLLGSAATLKFWPANG